MKKYYEKTNLNYIVIPSIVLLCAAIESMIIYDGSGFFYVMLIMNVGYIFLFVSCVSRTIMERKEFDEIITYGKCVDGIVKELVLVSYEIAISRTGDPIESNRYQIKVETKDGSGCVLHTHYSDLVKKKAIRHIPRKVLVYDYMGKVCIVWEKSQKRERFYIEKSRNTYEGNNIRMTFNYVTCIFLMVYGGTAVCAIIIALFG